MSGLEAHVTVRVQGGVLVVQLPVQVIDSMAESDLSDAALQEKLPEFGRSLAAGFAGQAAEPPRRRREPSRVNAVRLSLVRSVVVAESIVELDSPLEVYA